MKTVRCLACKEKKRHYAVGYCLKCYFHDRYVRLKDCKHKKIFGWLR